LLASALAIVARALMIHGRLKSALVDDLRRLGYGGRTLRGYHWCIIS
jgi:hypothetical protein